MAFENFYKEQDAYNTAHPKEMVRVVTSGSPVLNRSILLRSIYDINTMNDIELRKFVGNSFNVILNSIFIGKEESAPYIACFTNVRFLDAFIDVLDNMMRSGNMITKDNVIKINSICYEYIRLQTAKDNNVVYRMIRLGNIINRDILPSLLGLGLSNDLATMLVIARNSSFDLNVCIKRVDFIVINQPKELMSIEMIKRIYEYLFQPMIYWSKAFQHIMLDVLPEYSDDSWVTEEIQEVDSTLSLAALDILNELPSEVIRQTLLNYAEGYRTAHPGERFRFDIRKISYEHDKILNEIRKLEDYEGIYMPS